LFIGTLVLTYIIILIFAEFNNVPIDCESQPNVELEEILGNIKPLINILQDEINTVSSIGTINILISLWWKYENFNFYNVYFLF